MLVGLEHEIVYGQAISAAGMYVYDKRFDTTIYRWRLLMAPLDSAPAARAGRRNAVLSDMLLIGLMLGVMLLGTGFLVYAISRAAGECAESGVHQQRQP